jgi:hypothetical protein
MCKNGKFCLGTVYFNFPTLEKTRKKFFSLQNNMSTVTFIKKLWSHTTPTSDAFTDPYAQEILFSMLDPDTISRLQEYTLDLHYENFLKYDRPLTTERALNSTVLNCPIIRLAVSRILNDFACIKGLHSIRQSQFDTVRWIPTSAAGYGYIGKKAENYDIARRRATYNLFAFKDNDDFLFTPDKAFART